MKTSYFFSVLTIVTLLFFTKILQADALDDELAWLRAETYTITTASRYSEKISDTPASVMVITKQQIQQRRYLNLLDLLNDLPSVDVQKGQHEVFYNTLTFRGHIGSNKCLILQDGVRIDSPTGEGLAIFDNYPLYNAKRVEILYGPAAAVYGTEAFGGVINIITDTPDELNGVKIGGSVGSYDVRSGYLQAGKRLTDNFALEIGGHFRSADYSQLAQEYPNDYEKKDAKTFAGQVVAPAAQRESFVMPTDAHSFFAKAKIGKSLTLGYNLAYLAHPSTSGEKPSATLYSPDLRWINTNQSAYAKYFLEINSKFNTTSNLYYSRYEVDPSSQFKNIYVDYIDSYQYALGEKIAFEQQFQFKVNEQQKLTGGFLYEKFYSIPKTTDLPTQYNTDLAPNAQNMSHIGTNNSVPIDFAALNYHNIAGYLQLQSFWHKKFSTTIGVRYDNGSRYGGTFNPRAGFVYAPFETTTLKVLYGEAFRAPSPVDTSEIFGIFSGQQDKTSGKYISYFFQVPAQHLQPEKARTLEFEINHLFNKYLNVSVSGYYTKLAKVISDHTETTPTQFIPEGIIYSSQIKQNASDTDIYGFETSVNYQQDFAEFWKINFWGNYSYLNGHSHRNDNGQTQQSELFYIAPHKLKLGMTLNYHDDYFATLKWHIVSNTNTSKFDSSTDGKVFQSPSYQLLDLHLGATLIKGLAANVDIYNLLDTHYYNASSGAAAKFLNYPQTLRSLLFSLSYQF